MGGEMTEFDRAYDDARFALQYLAELYELRVQQARKLAEEYRNALIEVRDGVSIPSAVIGSLPWEEK
jgi:hypothetical protein